jgi:hypothetical protein
VTNGLTPIYNIDQARQWLAKPPVSNVHRASADPNRKGSGMNETPKVVGFPNTEEERARRLKQEVERLAALPTVEWLFYLETGELAEKHGIEPAKLKQMVETTIHPNEKKAHEAKADDRREKQEVERKQERENRLSRQEQERARKEAERARKEAERIEREQQARQKKRDAAFAEIAELPKLTHAARLKEAAARLGEDFEILRVEATGAAIFRIVDRLKPTLLLDEADTLFERSTVLAHIINASWTNGGQKIPRVGPRGDVVEFDP